VISGISYPLLERMYLLRYTLSSEAFRDAIVSAEARSSAASGINSKKSAFSPAP
jgi:mannose/fructose-specific phosphotransferase system component IIA